MDDDEFGIVLTDDEAEVVEKKQEEEDVVVVGTQEPEMVDKEKLKLELEERISMSPIPELCKNKVPVVIGVDEAGRGPVIGDLVYGLAYYPLSEKESIDKLGFDDSKKTSAKEREALAKLIEDESHRIGYVFCDLPAEYISSQMMFRRPVSLNELSYQAVTNMIKRLIAAGVAVAEIFVDAVGNCERYEERLRGLFPGTDVTVKPKADAIYKVVGAASILAKTRRDNSIKVWTFRELYDKEGKLVPKRKRFTPLDCTGYPSDPKTVEWLRKNADPVFGYPSIVRHSWKTTRNLYGEGEEELDLESRKDLAIKREKGELPRFCKVEWEKSDGESNQMSLFGFMQASKRQKFFQDRRLNLVQSFM